MDVLTKQNNIKMVMSDIKSLLNVQSNTHIGFTMDSVVIHLHNVGERPTVYTAQVKACRYGNVSTILIDTIINKDTQRHDTIKVSFAAKEIINAANVLNRLISQPCDGTRAETQANFEPIGLLYRAKENNEVAL